MDTKLKKSKAYSKAAKTIAVIAMFLSVAIVTVCALGLLWISDGLRGSIDGIRNIEYEKYTDTAAFREKFDHLADEAIKINLVYKSEGNIRDGNAIDRDELIEGFKEYYGIVDGVITANTEIDDNYTVEVTGEIPKELIVNYNEYENLVRTKLRDYKNIYIQNQLNDYIDQRVELDNSVNFFYCIETEAGDFVAGNVSREQILALNQHIVLDGEFLSDKMDVYTGYKNQIIADGNYTFYAGVPNRFIEGDDFYENSQDFYLRKQIYPIIISTMIVLSAVIIALIIYLIKVCGQDMRGGEVIKHAVDRIYNDIHVIIVFFAASFSMGIGAFIIYMVLNQQSDILFIMWGTGLLALILADTAIGLSFLCSLSRHIKAGTIFRHTLIAASFRKIGATLSGKSFSGWIITLFAGYTIIIALLSAIVVQSFQQAEFYGEGISSAFIFMLILITVAVTATIIVVRSVMSLSAIMHSAKKGASGQFDEAAVDINKITAVFSDFAEDINNMQKGLKTAVEEAIKGERMKTDLITNVSHDLKTPLTSIISYASLLDREQLNNENAEKYVDVIVEKSVRLKQLIEDLIEASKVSSGNISVDKSKIDYKQLVFQACGEYEEKFEAAQLEMRFNAEDEVYVYADGNHMWRIIDNLLSNVVKYAMPKTRVYIDVYTEKDKGVFVVKNTSNHEINYAIENLTERFFRGDEARSSEGSGLGLSIANSLADVQGGDFEIDADGDLFKVIVKMPLWREEKETES